MNSKGFTLIELLATITLLGVLMLIAMPNVVGVVNRNKSKTYVEDAKKLVALAEYKVRSSPSNDFKPSPSSTYCFYISALGDDDFGSPPNGGKYSEGTYSYVKVTNYGGTLSYRVQLIETKDEKKYGITEIPSEDLYKDDATKNVSSITDYSICNGTPFTS